jgi:orotidine-5'-phosphate decarboxylase
MIPKIIVAVDGLSFQDAEEKGVFKSLSNAIEKGMIWGVKVSDMLYSGDVTKIISRLKNDYKLNVMADVKLHDIPSTMENCISKLIDTGADIITIHCSSNFRPKNAGLLKHIAGVTILTSFTDLEVKWIYERITEDIVKAFSNIALMNNYEYIFCSVKDLNYLQDNPLKKICSGIRPSWYPDRHDQVKISSLKEAVRMGTDFITIGRPITQSSNIIEAIEKIYSEISQ